MNFNSTNKFLLFYRLFSFFFSKSDILVYLFEMFGVNLKSARVIVSESLLPVSRVDVGTVGHSRTEYGSTRQLVFLILIVIYVGT